MKKTAFLIFYLILFTRLTAQSDQWSKIAINDVLTISLPDGYGIKDTSVIRNNVKMNLKSIQLNLNNCKISFSIVSSGKDFGIRDRRSGEIILQGVQDGFCGTQSRSLGLTCLKGDTIIDKMPAKKLRLYKNETELIGYAYHFVANNITYQIYSSIDPVTEGRPKELDKILASIQLNKEKIPEYKFYQASNPEALNSSIPYCKN